MSEAGPHVTIADLDLTAELDQAARKLLGDRYATLLPYEIRNAKQSILDAILPMLPGIIAQVEQRTREQVVQP